MSHAMFHHVAEQTSALSALETSTIISEASISGSRSLVSLAPLLTAPDMLVLEVVYLTNVRGLSDVVRGSRTDRHQYVEVSDMRETYVCHLAVCCVV